MPLWSPATYYQHYNQPMNCVLILLTQHHHYRLLLCKSCNNNLQNCHVSIQSVSITNLSICNITISTSHSTTLLHLSININNTIKPQLEPSPLHFTAPPATIAAQHYLNLSSLSVIRKLKYAPTQPDSNSIAALCFNNQQYHFHPIWSTTAIKHTQLDLFTIFTCPL